MARYNERKELDPTIVDLDIPFDQVIVVDDVGYEYENDNYVAWAGNPDTQNSKLHPGVWDEYINGHTVDIIDPVDVVDTLDYFLDDLLPEDPGRYRISGVLKLNFTIYGMEYLDLSEDDREVFADDVEVELNTEDSGIEDFKVEAI